MTSLDKLQRAWQAQPDGMPELKADELLKTALLGQRLYFWFDMLFILVYVCIGVAAVGWTFQDIQNRWPDLIYIAAIAWEVGFILLNRWRRRRLAAPLDEPMLSRVETSIQQLEHQMWLDRNSFWWSELPLILGCLIPLFLWSYGLDFQRNPGWEISAVLYLLGFFVVVSIVIRLVGRLAGRFVLNANQKELQALQGLRHGLLNPEE